VDAAGIISTIAGTGQAGFSGDASRARTATLNIPGGLAIDTAGNVYVADSQNQRVRKFAAGGTIDTFAGNMTFRFGGDAGPASAACSISLARSAWTAQATCTSSTR
jgi:hypothetical protein